ncbi:MAG: hypothetical protein MK212_09200 [Saprospiraceae bacterium]|nr:hypothetical protein [Saprospiraceae bacterium]
MLPSTEQLQLLIQAEEKIHAWFEKFATKEAIKNDPKLVEQKQTLEKQLEQIRKAKEYYGSPQEPRLAGIRLVDAISDSVGYGGKNQPEDVLCVQRLFNKQINAGLPEDGKHSPSLDKFIRQYQMDNGGCTARAADANMQPDGHTWKCLSANKKLAMNSIRSRKEVEEQRIAREKAEKEEAAFREAMKNSKNGAIEHEVPWTSPAEQRAEVNAYIEQEISDDLVASLSVSRSEIAASLEKTWELAEYKSPAIPLCSVGVATVTVSFGAKLEAILKGSEKVNLLKNELVLGVDATIRGTGTVELALELPVCRGGGAANLIAEATASGEMVFAPDKREGKLGFGAGISGKFILAFELFVGAPTWMVEIYEFFGGDSDDLEYRKNVGTIELLNFKTPALKNGAITGSWELSKGKDLDAILAPINAVVDGIKKVYESVVAVIKWIGELLENIGEFLLACAEAIYNLITDPTETLKDWFGLNKEKYAQDAAYEKACRTAIEEAKENPMIMKRFKGKDQDEVNDLLKDYVAQDELVKHIWQAIYENKSEKEYDSVMAVLNADIKYFELKPKGDCFKPGQVVDVEVSLTTDTDLKQVKIWIATAFDGSLTTMPKMKYFDIPKGRWEKTLQVKIPENAATRKGLWQIGGAFDVEGGIKDMLYYADINIEE